MAKSLAKNCILATTVQAGEDLKKHRFVTFEGEYPAAAGDSAYGVTVNDADDDEYVTVDVLGITVVEATAAIAAGAAVQAEADGKAKTLAANEVQVGRALTAASAAGDLIRVLLIPN